MVNGKKADAVNVMNAVIDITDLLKNGENELDITVTSTLTNRLLDMGRLRERSAGYNDYYCGYFSNGLSSVTLIPVLSLIHISKSSEENQAAASDGTSGIDTGLMKNTSASGEGTSNKGSLDVSDIATEAMPSIVAITSKSVQEVESFFSQYGYGGRGYFGEPQTQETESSGSGTVSYTHLDVYKRQLGFLP